MIVSPAYIEPNWFDGCRIPSPAFGRWVPAAASPAAKLLGQACARAWARFRVLALPDGNAVIPLSGFVRDPLSGSGRDLSAFECGPFATPAEALGALGGLAFLGVLRPCPRPAGCVPYTLNLRPGYWAELAFLAGSGPITAEQMTFRLCEAAGSRRMFDPASWRA